MIRSSRPSQGVLLVEAVISLFVLLTAFTMVLTIYSRSLNHLTTIERNASAARFARNVKADLAQKAKDYEYFKSADWSSFDNVTSADFPGFEARVSVAPVALARPCTDFNRVWPTDQQTFLDASVYKATVTIFHNDSKLFAFIMHLSEPAATVRETTPVEITLVSGDLSGVTPDGEAQFQARLFDSADREIPDVAFQWSIVPVTGNATISHQTRDGEKGVMTNLYTSYGTAIYTGGEVRVRASTSYRGVVYTGESDGVTLLK